MKKLFLFLVLPLLISLFFFSCRKEHSCEGCINGNKRPVANAGTEQVITLPTNSVSLDGRSSSDPDGAISSFLWSKISGPATFNINSNASSLTVTKNLVTGTYLFELKVTDNSGLSARDTVMIAVDTVATTNHPPIADAGPDQVIILPTNSGTINGSASTDADNNIISYQWTKISGPSSVNIVNTNFAQTQVTSLVEGAYLFELLVIDSGGLLAKDTVQVIVNPPLLLNEIIFNNLTWNYWHDQNDSSGVNDEIYLSIPDTMNILTNSPLNIFVKLDSVGFWDPVNLLVNGHCSGGSYGYYIITTASNTLVLVIEPCSLNLNLIGTGASIKINY